MSLSHGRSVRLSIGMGCAKGTGLGIWISMFSSLETIVSTTIVLSSLDLQMLSLMPRLPLTNLSKITLVVAILAIRNLRIFGLRLA